MIDREKAEEVSVTEEASLTGGDTNVVEKLEEIDFEKSAAQEFTGGDTR